MSGLSPLSRRLIAEGCAPPDVPAIWRTAPDDDFATFIESLIVRDPTVANAVKEAARRLRARAT